MSDKIRPIYTELQGYLEQAPPLKNLFFDDENVWLRYNDTIDELSNVSGEDYSRFKVKIKAYSGDSMVSVNEYRSNLSGLISRLYGAYFKDEQAPFSGMPSTVIHQNQQQGQNVNVQILLEFRSFLDKKLNEVTDEKEKGFLEKIKAPLSGIKNVTDLIRLILSTGVETGMTIERIIDLLK